MTFTALRGLITQIAINYRDVRFNTLIPDFYRVVQPNRSNVHKLLLPLKHP